MSQPSIPKGTRDFSPEEMAKRNYIFDTIREVFKLYGFRQIETPAMENLSTLMGKYGEEGDKLLFKILNSGDYLNSLPTISRGLTNAERKKILNIDDLILDDIIKYIKNAIHHKEEIENIEFYLVNKYSFPELKLLLTYLFSNEDINNLKLYLKKVKAATFKKNIESSIRMSQLKYLNNTPKLTSLISEKGLRYDLTVPFARYVVMHRNEITFPFKRYQIQPVWRADRPQKGRYREFFQCDADIVGSDSLINEVELIQIADEVFSRFGIRVSIKLNNRKILSGIAEIIGEAEKITDITVAIDKLDKIGLEKVNEELASKGIPQKAIEQLQPIILLQGTNEEKLNTLKTVLKDSETGIQGVNELEYILNKLKIVGMRCELELDLTLARGLNYYTGAIIEVKALDVQIGSITGGGRYDNLTGIFGLSGVSGVGISFGADRIFDVLNQLDLYPKDSIQNTQVLFVNFGEKEEAHILPLILKMRQTGISTEIFPEAAKMKKQMSYADSNKIPYVAIVGENEINEHKITLKDMTSGEQKSLSLEECISILS